MDNIDNKVLVVRIDTVEAHPNASRLDLVYIHGWQCVAQRGRFQAGGLAVYIPIDSVLPVHLETALFPLEGVVHLSKSRIRTIRLRGEVSQGLLISVMEAGVLIGKPNMSEFEVGEDLTEALCITHYEPPAPAPSMRGDQVSKRKASPFFPVYSKLGHFKNYPDLFKEGEEVVVTEKIHGTNFRAGWVPTVVDSFWKRVKRFCGYLPQWEFVVGSHNVQISTVKNWKGCYQSDIYSKVVDQYNLRALIPRGLVVYGEIYGGGIQKGYTYGCQPHQQKLRIFDVLSSTVPAKPLTDFGLYQSWSSVEEISRLVHVPTVPVIYQGPYHKACIPDWESGCSMVHPTQVHREGCVVKPKIEQTCYIGRRVLRSVNPEYLLRSESDFH